jgi:hypothetical protein
MHVQVTLSAVDLIVEKLAVANVLTGRNELRVPSTQCSIQAESHRGYQNRPSRLQ